MASHAKDKPDLAVLLYYVQIYLLMGVVSSCKQRICIRRQMAVYSGVMTLEAFPAESNLWYGMVMGVV